MPPKRKRAAKPAKADAAAASPAASPAAASPAAADSPADAGPAPPKDGDEHLYSDASYWADRYVSEAAGEGGGFEWFLSYESLQPLLAGPANKRKSKAVLDLGCGNSKLLVDMRADGFEGRLVAVDFVESALETQRKLGAEEKGIELLRTDVRSTPFADESFDLIVDKGTVDAMISAKKGGAANVSAAMKEAARLLKHGGRLCVCSHHRVDSEGDPREDDWFGAVFTGLASHGGRGGAGWAVDVHFVDAADGGQLPTVYFFTKRRLARKRGKRSANDDDDFDMRLHDHTEDSSEDED
ncbi:S-adenosyl-L-methionine-dependent methyltransferase [Pelagophyceae sp. CCMP2097]|nr:S-adenosyl-L-methionine-dependent methyltransferase [Pelagophyceae sp. CCMP2097]